MIDAPEGISQKTLRSPHKNTVIEEMRKKNIFGKHPSEQTARNTAVIGLRKLRNNSLFRDERRKLFEGIKREKKLEETNIIDPLTKVYNRRFLEGNPGTSPPQKGILEREVERILRDKKGDRKLSIAMFDVDNFKGVNDKYGHQVGDEVLRKVAETVLKNIRFVGDFAIRYGGDEFLIITPNDLEIAQKMIEKIRQEIEKISFNDNTHPEKITISCGLTTLAENGSDLNYKEIAEAMINRADSALYESKREDGKNNTTIAVIEKGETKFMKVV